MSYSGIHRPTHKATDIGEIIRNYSKLLLQNSDLHLLPLTAESRSDPLQNLET